MSAEPAVGSRAARGGGGRLPAGPEAGLPPPRGSAYDGAMSTNQRVSVPCRPSGPEAGPTDRPLAALAVILVAGTLALGGCGQAPGEKAASDEQAPPAAAEATATAGEAESGEEASAAEPTIEIEYALPPDEAGLPPRPEGPSPPGMVWSAEHGHWHAAPQMTMQGGPGMVGPDGVPRVPTTTTTTTTPVELPKQPEGPVPEGFVWSAEHGHWHHPDGSGLEPGELVPQPAGEAPPGKVWVPEHGHWHDLEPAEGAPATEPSPTPGQH